jgi:autoinducer 2 (AI-2) kinase
VRCVLPLADWLASIVTGSNAMSRSLAVENGLLDIRTGDVPPEVVRAGLDGSLIATLSADGAIVGSVRSGPLGGVPVVLAGADTQCALVGMRATEPGDCAVAAGWSAPVQLVTPAPVFDPEMRTWTGVHVVPDRFVLESNASETGRAWAWICSLLRQSPDEAAAIAATAAPGADDVMTVLGPRVMRAAAMSAGIGGLTLPLPLAMSAPGVAVVLRSVLESIAYAIRANLEQIEEISSSRVSLLRLGGGMARMSLFAQILTDVIDRPVEVAGDAETSAIGAAALASVALGLYSSIGAAVDSMAGRRRAVVPDAPASAVYEDLYARWCVMADAFERIEGEGV